MPRKPKASAKPASKSPTPYPNPLPPSLLARPLTLMPDDIELGTSKASHDAQIADWTARNSRAKAIIMSTLVPGSEPWQIAQPLEYAADIWSALEERYGAKGKIELAVPPLEEDRAYKQPGERGRQHRLASAEAPVREAPVHDALAQEVSDGLQEVATLWTHEQEMDSTQPVGVGTETTGEQDRRRADHMRDQRFLWALLNGGKEGEMGQAVGKDGDVVGGAGVADVVP